jgi:hypothetical protein
VRGGKGQERKERKEGEKGGERGKERKRDEKVCVCQLFTRIFFLSSPLFENAIACLRALHLHAERKKDKREQGCA